MNYYISMSLLPEDKLDELTSGMDKYKIAEMFYSLRVFEEDKLLSPGSLIHMEDNHDVNSFILKFNSAAQRAKYYTLLEPFPEIMEVSVFEQ